MRYFLKTKRKKDKVMPFFERRTGEERRSNKNSKNQFNKFVEDNGMYRRTGRERRSGNDRRSNTNQHRGPERRKVVNSIIKMLTDNSKLLNVS
jgi:hypothetical protein